MKATKFEDLPLTRICTSCEQEKPREQMIIVRTGGVYYFRPKCKECNNKRERGHRREYKRKYLQRWRKENAAVNESYWKGDARVKERNRVNAYKHFQENHEAILIQGRMNRRGMGITLAEAKELLEKFGRCYPTRFGLTPSGLRECERMRSRLRQRNVVKRRRPSAFEIRMMVYEEDPRFVIQPHLQPQPYKHASRHLAQWHRNQRILEPENGR